MDSNDLEKSVNLFKLSVANLKRVCNDCVKNRVPDPHEQLRRSYEQVEIKYIVVLLLNSHWPDWKKEELDNVFAAQYKYCSKAKNKIEQRSWKMARFL